MTKIERGSQYLVAKNIVDIEQQVFISSKQKALTLHIDYL